MKEEHKIVFDIFGCFEVFNEIQKINIHKKKTTIISVYFDIINNVIRIYL